MFPEVLERQVMIDYDKNWKKKLSFKNLSYSEIEDILVVQKNGKKVLKSS